jgi:hypothetical protein
VDPCLVSVRRLAGSRQLDMIPGAARFDLDAGYGFPARRTGQVPRPDATVTARCAGGITPGR